MIQSSFAKSPLIQMAFVFLSKGSVVSLTLSRFPYSWLLLFFFFHALLFFLLPLSNLVEKHLSSKNIQTSLSSLLGLLIDLELFDSASLHKSFLRILATCCVNWTKRLFGKTSPINGFVVSLIATV